MSDFPYTNEQMHLFHRAAARHVLLDTEDTHLVLAGLRDAGITVQFPAPRFFVEWFPTGDSWRVYDREDGHLPAASIYGHHREVLARDLADRLNREAQP